MEDFINELKSNACSKSDYEKKINYEKMAEENREITIFCNELKNSIMQYSLSESKKGNYITNGNKHYLCLRIVIHSQFDKIGNHISISPNDYTDYNINTIDESKFGIDISDVSWNYRDYKKIAPHGRESFSNKLFPLCVNIEEYTVDHASKIKKLLRKHEITTRERIISNGKSVSQMRDFFVESFGDNIKFETEFKTDFIHWNSDYANDFIHVYRIYDIKIFF